MPNPFAWLALTAWPFVALAFYAARRSRGRLARTTAWMMILPVMFLPSMMSWRLPGLPELDKHRMSILAIAIALQLFHRREVRARGRWDQFPRLVLAFLVAGAILTASSNGDAATAGARVMPGLTARDVLSISISHCIDIYLPFVIGQRVFRTERDLRDLFGVLSFGALIYLPFCLLEVRLSPQLHRWVYGYFPSQFAQAVRAGGFRPVVFMTHGLSVATFSFSCLCAAVALYRASAATRPASPGQRALVSGVLVILCKSLGAILYSAAGTLLQLLGSSQAQRRVVLACALTVVGYPVMRASNLLSTADVVALFRPISADRAASLAFRFSNEDRLLAHAMRRPIAGWGTWGRNRVYDLESGQDLSVTDGQWIILLGTFGYLGFIGFFALLVVPLGRFYLRCQRLRRTARPVVGALALMVAFFTFDLLPNTLSDTLPLAYAGALLAITGGAGWPAHSQRRAARRARFVARPPDGPNRPDGGGPASRWPPAAAAQSAANPRRGWTFGWPLAPAAAGMAYCGRKSS